MENRLTQIPCGYLVISEHYMIVDVNDTFLDWTHFDKKELLGQHIEKLFTASNKLIFHSYFYPSMTLYQRVDELFIHVKGRDGETIPCLVNAKSMDIEQEKFIDLILMPMKKRIDYEKEVRHTKQLLEQAYAEKERAYEDLQHIYKKIELKQEQLVEMNRQLVEMSNTDKLTGIANRRFFQEQLSQQIRLYHEQAQSFSLLVLDIDHFKQVNDTYGHAIGDLVLVQLALILKSTAREHDTVARFGGEEFVMLLAKTDALEALEIAQQLNGIVEETIWPTIGRMTVSIGCTTFTVSDNETTVFEHADAALYESKRNGRNRTTQYEAMR